MRMRIPLVAILTMVAVVGCDAKPPTEPTNPEQSPLDLAASWTTTEVVDLQTNVVLNVTEDGRTLRVACGATNLDEARPAIVRDRTTNSGERQFRTRSIFTYYYFFIDYSEAGSNVTVERHHGPASGHFTVREDRNYPPKYILDYKINGRTEGEAGKMSLKCESSFDAERSPQTVYRIILADRCWEEPAGNKILPCH